MVRAGSEERSRRERNADLWALAKRQHGVVTRRQLLGLGFSRSAIEHRLGNGRLHRFGQGIFLVGRPESTRKARWMAAVLACGPEAALSHRSAAALWGIGDERRAQIDVSVRGRFETRRTEIRARGRTALPAGDIVERHGIPVTSLVRTLLDMACELLPARLGRRTAAYGRGAHRLERLISEADKLGLIDPETLRATLDGHRGEPGARALCTVLDRHAFRLSDSHLEIVFRELVLAARLPLPESRQMVNGYRVDFYWPRLGLVVETDGLTYHRAASTQSQDIRRDQTHTAAGLTALRFSHHQIVRERRYVTGILRTTMRRLHASSTFYTPEPVKSR